EPTGRRRIAVSRCGDAAARQLLGEERIAMEEPEVLASQLGAQQLPHPALLDEPGDLRAQHGVARPRLGRAAQVGAVLVTDDLADEAPARPVVEAYPGVEQR